MENGVAAYLSKNEFSYSKIKIANYDVLDFFLEDLD
jgi:hypothetical protein